MTSDYDQMAFFASYSFNSQVIFSYIWLDYVDLPHINSNDVIFHALDGEFTKKYIINVACVQILFVISCERVLSEPRPCL